jgi:S1-C subfamily serine protease
MAASFRPDIEGGARLRPAATSVLAIVLLCLVLFVVACSDDGAGAASAVGIEASGCGLISAVGSGAVVAEPGVVVTTAHTVAGSNEITVIDRHGDRHVANLLFIDPNQDIALLAAPSLDRLPLPIGSADAGDAGERTVWDRRTGFRTDGLTVTRELSVTIEDIYIDREVTRQALEFRGPVGRGDSGAVLVVDGEAVGMVYAKARSTDDLGYALDESELVDAIASIDPGYRGSVSSGECVP